MRLKLLFGLLIFTNIIWATTEVAPPSNDNFANAIPITCGNNYTGSTLEATLDEDNAPDSTTPAVDLDAPNIWYSYTGNGTPEIITLDLCASGYDTSYLVYAGASGNLNLVAANDDNETQCGPGYRSYGTFQSDGLTTYYITITGYGPSDIGAVDLNISCQEVVPAPNTIALAIPIVPSPAGTGCTNGYEFDLDFTTAGTTDSGLGGCLNGDYEGIDQFFTWTATTNGLKYSTPSFVGRAGMIIRSATAPYEIIDCSKALDNNDGIFTGWSVGDNLIIQIYKSEGFSGIADARFCLEEKSFSSPNNDFPGGAIPIVPGLAGSDCSITMNNQTLFLNTNEYTTTDSGMDNCVGDDTGVDQFFTWTATSGGLLWGQNPDNIGISVRSTSGLEYGCIVTNQGDPVKLSGWEIGEDLIIQLFNYENYHYDSLTFCLREYETPVNNIMTGAIPIVPTSLSDNCDESTLFFSTDGTTDSGLDGTCNTANTGYDQFFTWTATTNALAWTGLTENPGIIIRDTAGNEITCADTIAADNTILSGWEVGDELILQIYDWVFIINSGTAAGNVEDSYRNVSFCLKEHVLPPPPGQTYVPDDNFEQYLINQGYDTVLDNYVTTANINSITGIDVSNDNIADLTGIEDFTALRTLYASNNQLTSIDITQNVALENLALDNNNLSTLNITQNVLLRKLDIYYNQITSLDLTQNVALEDIEAWYNQFTTIDVSQNIALTELEIYGNSQLASIDVSTNTNLKILSVGFSQVSSIDVSNNLALEELAFVNCPVTHIDVSANLALKRMNTAGSLVEKIDVSGNPVFDSLFCQNSGPLTSINVANGNNSNFTFFFATNAPNIACVQVDDVAYSTANWTTVDAGINFSTDCGFLENDECVNAINIPISDGLCSNSVEGTLEAATNSNAFTCFGNANTFSDVWFSFVATETTHNVKILNTSGVSSVVFHTVIDAQTYTCGNITDAVYCTDALERQAIGLTVGNTYYVQVFTDTANSTETFDICVSTNTIPGQTYVPDDNFEQALIDLGYDDVLDDYVLTGSISNITELNIANKSISDLTGIEDFIALESLGCWFNQLTSIDLSQNISLTSLQLEGNQLTSIDLSQNINLTYLRLRTNQLTSIDLTNNINLTDLSLGINQLTTVDVSQNVDLTHLSLSNNQLTNIDLANNIVLENLYLSNNQLTSVDIAGNVNLDILYCEGNQLTTLDVSNNTNITILNCSNNLLTSLNVGNNTNLDYIDCKNNQLAILDFSINTGLRGLVASDNNLIRLNIKNGNNANFIYLFTTANNPNLECIEVDDVTYSTANWSNIDAGTSFSTDCGFLENDECVDAIDIPISDGGCNTTTSGTLAEATDSNVFNCFGSANFSDVWFSFVATETTHDVRILNTSGTNARVFHAVIDAQTYNCGNITDAVYCTDSTEGQATGLIVGNTYFVQVYTDVVNSAETFDICVASLAIPGQTYVPDDNFEQALIDLGYDIALDNYVTTTNIAGIENLDVSSKGISDLTGIEDFTALKFLYAFDNQLTSINVAQNAVLEVLELKDNNISTLDVTQNVALKILNIGDNGLTSIDLTQNTILEKANFQLNQLATIDVSQNVALEDLTLVGNTQLSSVDVSTNTNLVLLSLSDTQVSTINVSNSPNLEQLYLGNCSISSLDISANLALKTLSVSGTLLTTIDVSNHPAFDALFAENSTSLRGINVQNGNNTNFRFFFTRNTPNLNCVQVDDVAYSTANWTIVDAGTNFSTDCGFLENDECVNAINIPISNATCNNVLSATMVGATDSNSLQCFGNNANFADVWFSFVATETTHKIALQNLAGSPNFLWHALIDAQTYSCGNITDAIYCTDGLENTATELTIGNTYYIQVYSHVANANTTFDICVSTNLIPGQTYVPDNNFEQALIDLGYDTTLDDYVTTTNISSVNDLNVRNLGIFDLTGIEDFAALEILNCGLNFLGELDLSQNTNLNYLIADNAALVGLNVQNGNNTNVTTFITLGNVDLFCVQVDDATYSTTNWTIIEQTTSFSEYCGDPIQVDAKVYLQGAMLQNTDGFMRTDLKDNNLVSDVSSPYADGIAASDNVFFALGQDKIVDWVWVELRDANDATVIIDGKSALLQRDGDIVGAEGDASTPVSFSQAPGDYYIVIKHRNHLGIMSSTAFALSNTVTTVDFTNSNNQITYGANAQTTFGMPANTVGMWSGNVNGDTAVQYSGTTPDVPAILSRVLNDAGNFLNFPTYTVSGYNANDVNMDGNTQYTGTTPDTPLILQNILAHPGNFLNFSTYQIVEQLPQNE